MTIFAVISQPSPNLAKLPEAVAKAYPDNFLKLNEQVWVVASKDPIQDVSKKILGEGENGAAVIVEVGSYFGRAAPTVWSWIKSKWEATANG